MDQRQYEAMLSDAELRLRRLRTLYDHWFHGIERTEPQQQRAEVDRIILELRRQPQPSTALRLRFPPLPPPVPAGVLRKPGGTGTLQGVPPRPAPPLPAGALGAAAPKPPVPAPVNHAARAAGGGNGMSEDQIQRIYQRYVEARRQNAERTDNVRIETVAKTVRDMLPKLAEKHAGKNIDFEVVLKDGRVALKPVAK
jgi:hypothetical protein